MKAVVYGSLGLDITYAVPHLPGTGADLAVSPPRLDAGGPAATISLALAGWGLEVVVAGPRLDDGPLAAWIRRQLAEAEVALLEEPGAVAGSPPLITVMVTPDGERTMLGCDYSGIEWTRVPTSVWEGATVAVFDRYSGDAGARAVERAVSSGIPVVGDEVEGAAASHASLLIWSEADHTADEAAEQAARGPAVVLTAGEGPLRLFQKGEVSVVTPPAVDVVDSTGAGDVLTAACAAGLASGLNLATAVERAAGAAARYVSIGRLEGFPVL